MLRALVGVALLATACGMPRAQAPPAPPREFRGVWVATVGNIDWPSSPGLPTEQQQRELIAILEHCRKLNLNAVVLQVRTACDAFYESALEPWSEYLTGKQGQAPSPAWDPLAFAVEEAHRRGLELHAWFNPYRARLLPGKGPAAASHISRTRPGLVRTYGKYLWLDPGEKAVQDHTARVILDVVRRYDVDGVHIDDYFYPYRVSDRTGRDLPFPDDPSWQRYQSTGGRLTRDDWRRESVNALIERIYREVHAAKAWVKFGISPFGIWRPGNPPQIRGLDPFVELYADSRKWLEEGWCDYFAPQLYWRIDAPAQSYPALLRWWIEHNPKERHIWPGNYTSRVADGSKTAWKASELTAQIERTRAEPGAGGNVQFSMAALMENRGGISDALRRGPYAHPALVPATPWLAKGRAPQAPSAARLRRTDSGAQISWKPRGARPWLWVVQMQAGGEWLPSVTVPGREEELLYTGKAIDRALISAVDRFGIQSRTITAVQP